MALLQCSKLTVNNSPDKADVGLSIHFHWGFVTDCCFTNAVKERDPLTYSNYIFTQFDNRRIK